MAMIFSFNIFKQLETRLNLIIGTFNEAIILLLIYLVFCFNGDFVPDPEIRN